jgi:hypothetical protein
MTEWERTGDNKWRDKIVAGMDSIAAMPFGFLTGPNQLYGYDPKTGKLYALEEQVGTYNLATIMVGGEVVFRTEYADRPRRMEEVRGTNIAACTTRGGT